ncbi:MAG TPA: sigma-70 family RNA polymerase sigma factor [Verrucomicrobiae bacterium]|nr:sigma-70 family RNA polymerase sigma factor [Verrucomicrobiae bacterium]
MQPPSDVQLLRDYAERGLESAFAEIVSRHTDLVYSAALRQVYSPDLARDVTQSVFTDLARKASHLSGKLRSEASLVGWLYRGTRFAARDLNRGEIRRNQRERLAMEQFHPASETPPDWEQLRPALDDAMSELDGVEREALLLRYFKNHDLRTVGAALGISDDAAQKRVSRALERLRELFAKRGVAAGASGLAAIVSAHAVQAAPAGLALSVSTAATLTATTVATTIATQTTMNWINLKSAAAILTAALAAGSGTYLAKNHEAKALQQEVQAMQSEKAALLADRENALADAESSKAELAKSRENQNDLLRLRAEVAALRKQSAELNQLREQNRQLHAALQNAQRATSERNTEPEDEQLRQQAIIRMNDAKQLAWALRMFAEDNQNHFPSDLSQTTNYWKHANGTFTNSDNFEQVIYGSLNGFSNLASVIVVREKQAVYAKGKWNKAYGFADGHSEIKAEPAEGFEEWEKAHLTPQPGQQ